jgi:hypothetical protein
LVQKYSIAGAKVFASGEYGQVPYHDYVLKNAFPCKPLSIRVQALAYDGILRCQQSKEFGNPDIVLFGDSHAEHLFVGLSKKFPNNNVGFYIQGGAPILSSPQFDPIIEFISESDFIKTVFYNAQWSIYNFDYIIFRNTLSKLTKKDRSVFVLTDSTYFPFDAFACKFRQGLPTPNKNCTISISESRNQVSKNIIRLANDSAVSGVEILKTHDLFCFDERCNMVIGGQLLYRDNNHFNVNGSILFADYLFSRYPNLNKIPK